MTVLQELYPKKSIQNSMLGASILLSIVAPIIAWVFWKLGSWANFDPITTFLWVIAGIAALGLPIGLSLLVFAINMRSKPIITLTEDELIWSTTFSTKRAKYKGKTVSMWWKFLSINGQVVRVGSLMFEPDEWRLLTKHISQHAMNPVVIPQYYSISMRMKVILGIISVFFSAFIAISYSFLTLVLPIYVLILLIFLTMEVKVNDQVISLYCMRFIVFKNHAYKNNFRISKNVLYVGEKPVKWIQQLLSAKDQAALLNYITQDWDHYHSENLMEHLVE